MRLAEDFNAGALDAFHTVVREVTAHVGREPGLQFMPRWVDTGNGMTRRASARWFLPSGAGTANVGLAVDEYGHGPVWTVAGTGAGGPILSQELVLSVPATVHHVRAVAASVGLLVPGIEVTSFGDASPVYVPGVCSGWPNGSWHGPDCGVREPHPAH